MTQGGAATPEMSADDQARARHLSSGRVVMLSTFWNLLGRAAPILIALALTPALVAALGIERWGVYTIALSLVGFFGIFDFGIGRALTRAIAEHLGAGQERQAADLVLTGLLALTGLGTVAALLAAVAVPFWVDHGLTISPGLRREVELAFWVLCLTAPLVVLNAAMWGVLGAYQKFREANLIGIPIQAVYYVGPLVVLHLWNSLVGVILVLLACRLASGVIYWVLCLRAMPMLREASLHPVLLKPLLRIGGWMTVSNLAWPLLMYADRFLIAALLTASATAYYATPFDVIARFSIISIAIMSSAYPAMAVAFRHDHAATRALFRQAVLAIAVVIFPACLLVISFDHELLSLWLGPEFAAHSGPVLRWLGVGAFLTAADSVAAGLIDAIGRPDLNAKLSLVELVLSVALLLVLLRWVGIEGAAIAWTVRCVLDFGARLIILARHFPPVRPAILRILPAVCFGTLALIAIELARGVLVTLVADVALVLLFLAVVLRWSLEPEDRQWLAAKLRRLRGSRAAA